MMICVISASQVPIGTSRRLHSQVGPIFQQVMSLDILEHQAYRHYPNDWMPPPTLRAGEAYALVIFRHCVRECC